MYLKNVFLVALAAIHGSAAASLTESVEARAKAPCYDSAPDSLCGVYGTLQDPKPFKHAPENFGSASGLAKNVVSCRALCIQFGTRCRSVAFNPSTGYCQLYKATLADQGFAKSSTPHDHVFYDAQCFKCLDSCPRPLEHNLVVNGGFDAFPKDASPWIGLIDYQLQKPGFSSPQAFGFKQPIHETGYLGQRFFTCRADYYLVTFNYKSIPVKHQDFSAGLRVQLGSLVYQDRIPPKDDHWISAGMLARLGGHEEILFKPGPAKQFLIDNVDVQRIHEPKVAPHAKNLITNPGFESGSKGYKLSENCKVVSTGHHSAHSVLCNGGTVAPIVKKLHTQIPYVMTFDYKISAPKGEFCYIRPIIGGHWRIDLASSVNSGWKRHRFVFLVVAPPKEVYLDISGEHAGRNCDVYIDNLTLKEASLAA